MTSVGHLEIVCEKQYTKRAVDQMLVGIADVSTSAFWGWTKIKRRTTLCVRRNSRPQIKNYIRSKMRQLGLLMRQPFEFNATVQFHDLQPASADSLLA